MAIITHAGGPAVMLADALEAGGLTIPHLPDSPAKERLQQNLFPGSSVGNPIDFLATGTAEQLGIIIDACENDFEEIDGMAIIHGSTGLTSVKDVYEVLDHKMKTCKKPIYPILPSVLNVQKDLAYFLSHGNINFPDEVLLGRALTRVYSTPPPSTEVIELEGVDIAKIRQIIENSETGQLSPNKVRSLLLAASIPMCRERIVYSENEAITAAHEIGFPVVIKVVGPVHKTDVGGVSLNIRSDESVRLEFNRLMKIEGAVSVSISEQLEGTELFIGAVYEPRFGHVILCGIGGIFVEVFKDVTSGLAPLTMDEAPLDDPQFKSISDYKRIQGETGSRQL